MTIRKLRAIQLFSVYSLSRLSMNGAVSYLAASDRDGGCLQLDRELNVLSTVFSGTGGVMSLVPLPDDSGRFIAVQEFYSPDDAAGAKLVLCTPTADAGWAVEPLCPLPFVHRVDLLPAVDGYWLLAFTIKSDHRFEGDWGAPGQVLAAHLPHDLSNADAIRELRFEPIRGGLLKNHGYTRHEADGITHAVVAADNGVFLLTPPQRGVDNWRFEQLIDQPASDACLIDLDEDGEMELFVLSPFHGDEISLWKKKAGRFELWQAWTERYPFLHAIWPTTIAGRPVVIFGARGGDQSLNLLSYDLASKTARVEQLDSGIGPANVLTDVVDGDWRILSANRESHELALYGFVD